MKKALLTLALVLMLLLTACGSDRKVNSTAAESAASSTTTMSAEEIKLYTYWKTMVDGGDGRLAPGAAFQHKGIYIRHR